MPVFEYRCEACESPLEVIVLPKEKAPEACPDCGGALQRRWSRVGAQFVGWGFAKNDAMIAGDRPRKPYKQIRDKAAELFD